MCGGETSAELFLCDFATLRKGLIIRYFIGFIIAVASWAICAFLFVPDGEDFGGLGQMIFMAAMALAWIPMWTWLVASLWREPRRPALREIDRFIVSPRRHKEPGRFFVPLGAVLGLVVLIVLAKAVEQDAKYGTMAMKLTLAIAPAAIVGGTLGMLAGKSIR